MKLKKVLITSFALVAAFSLASCESENEKAVSSMVNGKNKQEIATMALDAYRDGTVDKAMESSDGASAKLEAQVSFKGTYNDLVANVTAKASAETQATDAGIYLKASASANLKDTSIRDSTTLNGTVEGTVELAASKAGAEAGAKYAVKVSSSDGSTNIDLNNSYVVTASEEEISEIISDFLPGSGDKPSDPGTSETEESSSEELPSEAIIDSSFDVTSMIKEKLQDETTYNAIVNIINNDAQYSTLLTYDVYQNGEYIEAKIDFKQTALAACGVKFNLTGTGSASLTVDFDKNFVPAKAKVETELTGASFTYNNKTAVATELSASASVEVNYYNVKLQSLNKGNYNQENTYTLTELIALINSSDSDAE